MPSSVFGGKNSNEKTGRRSSRISSIRMREGYARAPVLLLGRDDVEVGRELRLAVQRVLHVHRVVLAIGAEEAEEDGCPADAAELALLLQVPRELQRVVLDLVVDAFSLRHAVHEHAVGRLGATRQVDGPAGTLREAHAAEGSQRLSVRGKAFLAPEVNLTSAVTFAFLRCLSSLRPALLSLTLAVVVLPSVAANFTLP